MDDKLILPDNIPDHIKELLELAAKEEKHEDAALRENLGVPRLTLKSKNVWPATVSVVHIWPNVRGYYSQQWSAGSSARPDCTSVDGVHGNGFIEIDGKKVEHNNKKCADCPMDVFGSAKMGRGKACPEKIFLMVHRDDEDAPDIELVQVPIMSRNNLSTYALTLKKKNKGMPRFTAWTTIDVRSGESGDFFVFDYAGLIEDTELMGKLAETRAFIIDNKLGLASGLEREAITDGGQQEPDSLSDA